MNILTIKNWKDEISVADRIYKFVVTGPLNKIQGDRQGLKFVLAKKGHKLVSAISKQVDYLITNSPNSGTTKNNDAKKLGIPIITEDELIERFLDGKSD